MGKMRKEEFGTASKIVIIIGYWFFSLLMIGLLFQDLIPFCQQAYPKVALGLALYAPEAILILLAAGIGLVFTYVRIMSVAFKSISNRNAIGSSIMLIVLISVECAFLLRLACL